MQGQHNRRDAMYRIEYVLVLLMFLFIASIALHVVVDSPAKQDGPDLGAGWQSRLGWVVKLIGAFLGLAFLFHAREVFSLCHDLYAQIRLHRKLNWLIRLATDSKPHADEVTLHHVLDHLSGGDTWTLRRHALAAVYCLVRANTTLADKLPGYRSMLQRLVYLEPGFARTLREKGSRGPLIEFITLGAKLGAGTLQKRISPVSSNPSQLASWIVEHRDSERLQELQLSIGYDTGGLPYLEERGKFLALYLFIVSTDLDRFQALTSNPQRDPNAAYGLLIRGDRIEVLFPGQQSGRRLDYVFPCPSEMTQENLTHFLRGIQFLNLGLLIATAIDCCETFFPGEDLVWLTAEMERVADLYRGFERSFVALLRQFDVHRDPAMIFDLETEDHCARQRAFTNHRLEECLCPQYSWVVPLYSEDTRWERLVDPLRGIEGMMLHQGHVPGKRITRGLDFIHQVRLLGYRIVTAMQQGISPILEDSMLRRSRDPFLDLYEHREATEEYLKRMQTLIATGELPIEALPDPVAYRRASRIREFSQAEEV